MCHIVFNRKYHLTFLVIKKYNLLLINKNVSLWESLSLLESKYKHKIVEQLCVLCAVLVFQMIQSRGLSVLAGSETQDAVCNPVVLYRSMQVRSKHEMRSGLNRHLPIPLHHHKFSRAVLQASLKSSLSSTLKKGLK